MTCKQCEQKMKCVYSVPSGSNGRYRVYRCSCGTVDESLEVLSGDVTTESGQAALRRAREGRIKLLFNLKRAKG